METLSEVKTVVLDKTGTLTKGVFEVVGIHHAAMEEEELLMYAAHAEAFSTHPIAKSILNAYGKPVQSEKVSEVIEKSGGGVIAKVDGRAVAVGNARLMEELGAEYKECHSVGTVVHIAIDGKYGGHLLISDVIKKEAEEAIRRLRERGVRKIVMLTGDNEAAAEDTAKKLAPDAFYASLLPEGKVECLEKLLSQKEKNEKIAFAGDGINDAPVLSRADVGIAMGALGSDAAIEAADVVLMDDDPRKIAKAIGIASQCMRVVRQNIAFSVAVKLLCLVLGALGIAGMWSAVFADVGVMVLCVFNAVRVLNVKKIV